MSFHSRGVPADLLHKSSIVGLTAPKLDVIWREYTQASCINIDSRVRNVRIARPLAAALNVDSITLTLPRTLERTRYPMLPHLAFPYCGYASVIGVVVTCVLC